MTRVNKPLNRIRPDTARRPGSVTAGPRRDRPTASAPIGAIQCDSFRTNALHVIRFVHTLSPMKTRAVAYLRVSTEKQADAGVSLDAQRAKIEAYASLYDLELCAIVVDAGVSAKTLARPGLTEARGLLASKTADALIVAKLDRLTRSVRDLGELIESDFASNRAALLSVGEQIDTRSAAGRLVLNILGSVSQWEREAIGERTSAAMLHMSANGEYVGGDAPYGYGPGVDGKLVAIEIEQDVLALARELRASGLSLRVVARRLDAAGFRARSGKPFAAQQIARMVAA